MEKQIEIVQTEWDKLEILSDEYKEEFSDLTNKNYRNWVLFLMLSRMDDSQLKVAIFEHLKSENYIVPTKTHE